MPSRRFPKPWSVVPVPSGYRVIEANGSRLSCSSLMGLYVKVWRKEPCAKPSRFLDQLMQNLTCTDALSFQPEDDWEEAMTAKKKTERPEKHVNQDPDLGQKEAALEKEKEAEMHHMEKGQPSASRSNAKGSAASRSPGAQK